MERVSFLILTITSRETIMRLRFLILLTIFGISFCKASDIAQRQQTALMYYLNNDKYQIDTARGSITKAYAIFALASMSSSEVSSADIDYANQLLAEVYTKWPVADEDNGLYWMLPHLSRILAGDDLNVFLSQQAKESVKNALQAFVYERDNLQYASTDQENIWLVLDSDNHDMIKKQVYFTAAQAFKNNPDWAGMEYVDGKTPAEHFQAWNDYFEHYFRERAKKGVNIEVGSPVYAGVFLESIYIIRDLAEDNTLKYRAEQYLNLYFADQALCSINGVRGGAKSRSQKGASSYIYTSDKGSYYAWMLTGDPAVYENGNVPFDILPALNSDFCPNEVVLNLYDHQQRGDYEYISTRPGKGTHYIGDYDRPHYNVVFPSKIRWYSWCNNQYILGSVTIDEDEDYTLISDQNRWSGLIAADNPTSRIFFAPSVDDSVNTYRDFAAVQYKGAMLIRRHTRANSSHGFRVYLSSTFSRTTDEQWIFGANSDGSVYFAIYAAEGDLWGIRYTTASASPAPGVWVEFNNPDTIVIFEAAVASDFTDIEEFKTLVKTRSKGFDNNRCYYNALADNTLLSIYTDATLPEINGQTVSLDTAYGYNSPFLQSEYDSYIIDINDQLGNSLTLDFESEYIPSAYLDTDFNTDGYVDLSDMAVFFSQWQQCTNPNLPECLNLLSR